MGELSAESPFVQQVHKANTHPSHFVLVRRTNATTGSADATFSTQTLTCQVDRFVIGHNQVRSLADFEKRRVEKTPLLLQRIDFLYQYLRINHHAVADDAHLVCVQYPGRDQTNDGLFPAHHQGVPRVVPTLKPDNDI